MTNLVVSFLVKMQNAFSGPAKVATTDFTKMGRAAAGAQAPIGGVGAQLDHIQAPAVAAAAGVNDVTTALAAVPAPAAAASAGVQDVGDQMDDTGSKASRFASLLGHHLAAGLAVGVTALSAYYATLVGGVTTVALWVHGQAQVAEETLHAAEAAGISATSFQRLQYAFNKSNLDGGALGKTLSSLQDRMVTSVAGNKQMADAFNRLGVHVRDSKKHYKAVDVVLSEVADGFARLRGPTEKAKIASILFGESARDLIPLLNQGAKGLKDLGDQAESYGLILSSTTLTASQKLNGVWDVMTDRVAGLKLAIFTGLLPAITGLIDKIGQIIEQNRENILKGLTVGLAWLNSNLPAILDGTGKFFAFLGNVVSIAANVTTAVGGIGNVFDIIAVSAATTWTYSLITATAAIWGVNGALYAFPGTWIIAAIAAVAVGAFLVIRHWTAVSTFFSGLWTGIKTIFGNAVKWISDHFMSLPLPLKWLALPVMIFTHWKEISGFFSRLFSGIANVWSGLPWWAQALLNLPVTIVTHWSAIAGYFKGVFARIGALWKALPWWAQAIVSLPATIIAHWNELGGGLAKAWATVKTVFKDGVKSVWDALPEWFQKVLKGIAFGIRFITGGPDLTSGLVTKGMPPVFPTAPPATPPVFPKAPPAATVPSLTHPASLSSLAPAQSLMATQGQPSTAAQQPTGGRVEIAVLDDRVTVRKVTSNPGTQMYVDRGIQGAFG